jgi:hypothetical protein
VLTESVISIIERTISVSMTTLDKFAAHAVFAQPDFIKLDLQGYELEILRGAGQALPSRRFSEVNLIGTLDGASLFHEATQFMTECGSQVHDICSLFRQPYDGALWQVDVIFICGSSPLVDCKRWA